MEGDADLLEVVDALHPPGRFARGLYGGQQKCDQDRDNRDHDQELDEGEALVTLQPHLQLVQHSSVAPSKH